MIRLLDFLSDWIAKRLNPDDDDGDACEHNYRCTWCGQDAGPGE